MFQNSLIIISILSLVAFLALIFALPKILAQINKTIQSKAIKKQNEKIEYVKNNSHHYLELIKINKLYNFDYFENPKTFNYSCNNLNSFRNFDFNKQLIEIFINNEDNAKEYILRANKNNFLYQDYLNRIKHIVDSYKYIPSNCQIDQHEFMEIQKNLINDTILKPPITVNFIIHAYYLSPAGRNHYFDDFEYSFCELKQYQKEAERVENERNKYKKNSYNERSKMTPTLRYKILKRDNYRCQICGATANDGVKLHVDHIIPVSKGGLTEESNLQTLCDQCNFGKSNKI